MVRLRRGVVLIGLSVAALVPVTALADQAYTDPAGDSGSAPDILGVSVTNDVDEVVRFAIQFGGGAELPGNGVLELLIDTDANGETGNEEGAEVVVGFYGDKRQYSYGRWDGTKIDDDAVGDAKDLAFRPGEVAIELLQQA